ncbi:hypothetical protein P0R33_06290 [Flavobacterium sp. YJ01]|uniref:DoxX family protein n=1 Tax=Flavobacterium sp. YJ01 TaxID=3031997 RepID=UPI0023E45290|nr:MauE/DoxX family redox-associated membrane protein [Flavobacterium sp. YJ01]WET03943.1 hypothetical protein P0R33_06290 [Flavobacterium sp. YJ01]
MNIKPQIKNIIIESICFLYILLFVYAAISKLIDFENFQVQIGQSPLLSPFAVLISWLVPSIELIICLFLLTTRWKAIGLHMSFFLMIMFTAYIAIILNFSSFVPCSCGGVLEKLDWDSHLAFNLLFVLLALLGLILLKKRSQDRYKISWTAYFFKILVLALSSASLVVILFLYSEKIMHHENPFIRSYPQHPVTLEKSMDLKFNSYYFAGFSNGRLYLGNYTNALHVIKIDQNFKVEDNTKIDFKGKNIPFRIVRIAVRDSSFYLMDGTVPCIYKGHISDWKITQKLENCPSFTIAEPLDKTRFAIRSLQGREARHVLGIFDPAGKPNVTYKTDLLQQQIDGVFDTDGMLISNYKNNNIVYVYYYRNEFITADQNLNLAAKGKTIDTISKAQIKVAYLKNRTERKMAAPPIMVNQKASFCGNVLFIQSKIPGKFEPENIWEQGAVVDVYNLKKKSYLMSFTIYGTQMKKLSSLYVTETHLYAIMEDELVVYSLNKNLQNEIKEP